MVPTVTVRLPVSVVAFLAEEVHGGRVSSRAALVASALEREMRRLLAERDVEILQTDGAADDLDGLVDWSANHLDIGD